MKKTVLITLYLSLMAFLVSMTWLETRKTRTAIEPTESDIEDTLIQPISTIDLKKNWGLSPQTVTEIKKAWDTVPCNQRIVVAVIDTGIDYSHPALRNSLWKNPEEIENNGIDDDGNGYVDDVFGWDFVDNDAIPQDDHGHGTHVSGIISALTGSFQSCSKVSLMVIKYYDANAAGQKNLENTIKAFRYAVQNHAAIINYSGGGSEYSEIEHKIIAEAREKGILVVAAAGNEKQNTDIYGYYPASYDLSNIISVAAITKTKKLVVSSNYGVENVDVAAPGKNIYSTLPHHRYGYMTGTSQAAAYVTGLAALTLALHPSFSINKLKSLLIQNIIPIKSLSGKIKTSGIINAKQVLEIPALDAIETSSLK